MKTYFTFDHRALRMDARACGSLTSGLWCQSYHLAEWYCTAGRRQNDADTSPRVQMCFECTAKGLECSLLKWRQTLCNTAEPRRRKPKRWKARGGVSACPFFFLLHSLPLRLGEVYPWWTSLVLPGDKVAWEQGFDEQSRSNGGSPANTPNTGTDRWTNTCMCANTCQRVAFWAAGADRTQKHPTEPCRGFFISCSVGSSSHRHLQYNYN